VLRSGLPLEEWTAFELLLSLESQGWSLQTVATPADASPHQALDDDMLISDAVGAVAPQIIWVRLGARRLSRCYLLALHSASTHKQLVRPFLADAKYQAMVRGELLTEQAASRRVRSALQFSFVDADVLALKDVVRPRRPAARRVKPVASKEGVGSDLGDNDAESALEDADWEAAFSRGDVLWRSTRGHCGASSCGRE
jgi:hypothetical protein